MKDVLFWICLACCLQACMEPPIDSKLKLLNASKKPFLVVYTVDSDSYHDQRINGLSSFNPFHVIQQADTTRGYQAGLLKDDPNYLAPGQQMSAHTGGGKWEDNIGRGKLKVYLFKPETVLTNSWDEIRSKKKWDRICVFTLEQVKTKDWVISL